jgi:excisionase family DNA binding protein
VPPPDYSEFEAYMGFKTKRARRHVPRDVTVVRAWYDRRGAAYQLNISLRTVDNLLRNKQLLCKRVGGSVRISHEELTRFMRKDRSTS